MSVNELKVYEIFKSKLGEAEAQTIIEYFEQKSEEKINSKKDIFLTKEDKTDMIKWMFIFWVGQLAAMLAIVKLMWNKSSILSFTITTFISLKKQ